MGIGVPGFDGVIVDLAGIQLHANTDELVIEISPGGFLGENL